MEFEEVWLFLVIKFLKKKPFFFCFFVVVVVFGFVGKGRRGEFWVLELCNYITNLELGILFFGCHKRWWCWICGIGFLMMELGMSLGDSVLFD